MNAMIKGSLPVIILVLAITACSNQNTDTQKTNRSLTTAQKDSLTAELDSVLKHTLIPGFAVALVSSDAVVYKNGFGYADVENQKPYTTETINAVASVSKTFVAVALMQLVDSGIINLDDPVNSVLPYRIINPWFPSDSITIRHLVTHTSTLTQEFDPEDAGSSVIYLTENYDIQPQLPADFSKSIAYYKKGKKITLDEHIRNYTQPGAAWYTKDNFLKVKPGTKFDYSNLNATIIARIIEIKTGMNFDEYTRQHIFLPHKMSRSCWDYGTSDSALYSRIYMPDDRRKPSKALVHPRYAMTDYPAGGLKTSIDDLSKFLSEIINGYKGKGKLLSNRSYQVMLNSAMPDSCFENRSDYLFNDQYNAGVFWSISPKGYRLHNGGSIGVYSYIYFDPAESTGAIAFCNLPVDDFGKVRDIVHKYLEKIK